MCMCAHTCRRGNEREPGCLIAKHPKIRWSSPQGLQKRPQHTRYVRPPMDLKRDMGLHREDRLATLAMAPKRAGWEGRGPRPQRSKGAPGGTRSRVSNHVCDEYRKGRLRKFDGIALITHVGVLRGHKLKELCMKNRPESRFPLGSWDPPGDPPR